MPRVFVFFLLVIVPFIVVKCERNPKLLNYSFPYNDQPRNNEQFDFIIVGAGSAGSVLANRLSEVSQWRILLVEAGNPPIELTDIPMMTPIFYFSQYNWNYLMEYQENMCLGLENQTMAWPRGKGIGGSSLINYMIHTRGNRLDYDKWAQMGNPGWSYEDVLPYFKKSEDARIRYQQPQYHHRGGYLTVEDVRYRTESAKAFVEALQELGYEYVDYNGHQQIGVSFTQATLRDGKRCSGEKAFLRPTVERKNLKILKRTFVTKILIDRYSREAYGIRFERDGVLYTATAKKEVIVSAGTFNSPKLLMLSGVGPKDQLDKFRIPVLQILPVGKKMYDHLAYPGLLITLNESITLKRESLLSVDSYLDLYQGRPSPLSLPVVMEALAYMNLNLTDQNPEYPDTELVFMGGGFHADFGLIIRNSFRITDEVYNKIWKPIEFIPTCQVFPVLVHPKSFGEVQLRSKNPYDPPKLYGNFFTDPDNEDVKTFVASIRAVQRIIQAPAFRKYDAKLVDTPLPGCEKLPYDSDLYWECALKHLAVTVHHQVGTCKMGPRNVPEAVVDSRLKVYGIKRLRVADSSIIPLPLTAHTNVPAYLVGEKAADFIKQDHGLI